MLHYVVFSHDQIIGTSRSASHSPAIPETRASLTKLHDSDIYPFLQRINKDPWGRRLRKSRYNNTTPPAGSSQSISLPITFAPSTVFHAISSGNSISRMIGLMIVLSLLVELSLANVLSRDLSSQEDLSGSISHNSINTTGLACVSVPIARLS